MNRHSRRAKQSQLRGHLTTTTITVDPNMPGKGLSVPAGFRLKTEGGVFVETTKAVLVQKKWWWKFRAKIDKKWRPGVVVTVKFI
ncbi:hypothetical protein MASR1M48_16840 [Lactococcus petauri]